MEEEMVERKTELGMPSLVELDGLDANAELAAELGLDFVELNANLPQFQAERLNARRLRSVTDALGVRFTVHMDERMDPCDFNPHIACAYRQTALEWIALARAAGIRLLNMHLSPGVYFTLPEGRVHLYARHLDHYLLALQAFRDACARAAAGEVVIAVENTDGFAPFARQGVDLLLESDAFALTLDVGHELTAGRRDADFMDARAARIRHLHLHGVQGGQCHLPLDVGGVNIRAVLAEARKWAADVVVEVKTVAGLRRSLEWLKANGEMA